MMLLCQEAVIGQEPKKQLPSPRIGCILRFCWRRRWLMSSCVLGWVGGGIRLLSGSTSSECFWGVNRAPRLSICSVLVNLLQVLHMVNLFVWWLSDEIELVLGWKKVLMRFHCAGVLSSISLVFQAPQFFYLHRTCGWNSLVLCILGIHHNFSWSNGTVEIACRFVGCQLLWGLGGIVIAEQQVLCLPFPLCMYIIVTN